MDKINSLYTVFTAGVCTGVKPLRLYSKSTS